MGKSNRYLGTYSILSLFLAVTVVAVIFASWKAATRKFVTVRLVAESDIEPSIFPDDGLTPVAAIIGRDEHQIHVSLSMHAIQKGQVADIGDYSFMRRPILPNDFFREGSGAVVMSLANESTPRGNSFRWDFDNVDEGRGYAGGSTNPFPCDHSATFEGTLLEGASYVIHAQGDRLVDFDRRMTLQRFVKRNQGNYFVILAELER